MGWERASAQYFDALRLIPSGPLDLQKYSECSESLLTWKQDTKGTLKLKAKRKQSCATKNCCKKTKSS